MVETRFIYYFTPFFATNVYISKPAVTFVMHSDFVCFGYSPEIHAWSVCTCMCVCVRASTRKGRTELGGTCVPRFLREFLILYSFDGVSPFFSVSVTDDSFKSPNTVRCISGLSEKLGSGLITFKALLFDCVMGFYCSFVFYFFFFLFSFLFLQGFNLKQHQIISKI